MRTNFSSIYYKIKKFTILPVIDKKTHKVVKILNYERLNNLKLKNLKKINCSVVIMAGGKGTRLKPYTDILPKPLLPINKKPAIRHILEKFDYYSPTKFFVTVNYKAEVLKSYFYETQGSFKIEIINGNSYQSYSFLFLNYLVCLSKSEKIRKAESSYLN